MSAEDSEQLGPTGDDVAAPAGRWGVRRWRAMGSEAEVVLWANDPDHLLDGAVEEIERLERSWSRFRDDAELARLNAAALAGVREFRLSSALFTALAAARAAWVETEGRFDPTVGGALVALGYDRSFRDLAPDLEPAVHSIPGPGFGEVTLDAAKRALVLPAGVQLDLGGIGKGLAADRVAATLVTAGAGSCCVSIGGDIAVAGVGPDAGGRWLVDVEHPVHEGEILTSVGLRDEAVVCSSRLHRRWRRAGVPLHHIIDPVTGWPAVSRAGATTPAAVVVRADRASRAEALAKAAILAGFGDGAQMLRRAEVAAWLVGEDGSVVTVGEQDP